jgi:hypothetical protein
MPQIFRREPGARSARSTECQEHVLRMRRLYDSKRASICTYKREIRVDGLYLMVDVVVIRRKITTT